MSENAKEVLQMLIIAAVMVVYIYFTYKGDKK